METLPVQSPLSRRLPNENISNWEASDQAIILQGSYLTSICAVWISPKNKARGKSLGLCLIVHILYLFHAERQLFVAGAPFLGGGTGLVEEESVAKRFAFDIVRIALHDGAQCVVSGSVNADMIEHLEARVFAHRLNL